jgi:putative ABC transport system permease protein
VWKNYLKVAWRNLIRHKGHSFINIFGLAVGLASCIMILLWVRDEMSYDRFHVQAGAIHRVIVTETLPGGGRESFAALPPNLGPALKAEFPEVRQAVRHKGLGPQIVANGGKRFYEENISLVDPEFLLMFSFPLRRGEVKNALSDPHAIVLTEAVAEKYFGREDPLGKSLRLNNRSEYTVTGILADIPEQSHLSFDILLPFLAAGEFGLPTQTWERFSYDTYVQLEAGSDVRQVNKKIATWLRKPLGDTRMILNLQPLVDIHLHSTHIREGEVRGDIRTVFLFSLLALLILFMACINYLNLTTARSGIRSKEIGLRKVVGARRGEIVGQFLGESIYQTAWAMIVAMILIGFCLPLFNALSGKEIAIGALFSPSAGVLLLGFLLVTGLLSGIYPAWYLSRFTPAAVLKGDSVAGAGGSRFRKLLVVFQFSLTIVLIIGSLSMYRQLQFLRSQKLGFDKEQVLMVPLRGDLAGRTAPLKAEILRDSSVVSASAASDPVMMFHRTIDIGNWEGKKPGQELKCDFVWCDEDYLLTNGIDMAQGQFFSRTMSGSLAGKIVINETAANALGFDSPIGKRLDNREIIGVVKDFHSHSLHSIISPIAMVYDPVEFRYLFIKIKPGDATAVLASLAKTWKRVVPDYPFEISFLDQQIDKLYRADQKLGGVVTVFTLLALLIANLGLLGMASYLAARRRKEIGVRKALGASVLQIVALLSRQFVVWVALAACIACPVAFYALNQWLRTFAYRISVGVGVFVFSILMAFAIALLTIGYQAIRAARANPVDCLRYE